MLSALHLPFFFTLLAGLIFWATRRTREGWRTLAEDGRLLETALGESEPLDDQEATEDRPRPLNLPRFLWTLSQSRSGQSLISAAEASALYEGELADVTDDLSRIANLSLLTGVCGTLTGMLLAITRPGATSDIGVVLGEAAGAFIVTVIGIFLAAAVTVVQAVLARRIAANSERVALVWTAMVAATPLGSGVDRSARVSKRTIEAVDTALVEMRGLLDSIPGTVRDQEEAFRTSLAQVCERFEGTLSTAQGAVVIATQQREEAQSALTGTLQKLDGDVESVRQDIQGLQQLVKTHENMVASIEAAATTMRAVSNEALTSQEQYVKVLHGLRDGFKETMAATQRDLGSLKQQIGELGRQHAELLQATTRQLSNEISTLLKTNFEQLSRVEEELFQQLINLKNLAPGVRDAIDTIEPGATAASAAIKVLSETSVTTSTEVEASLQRVQQRLEGVGDEFERSLGAMRESVTRVGTAAQDAIRATGESVQDTLRLTRWVLVPGAAFAVLWIAWLAGSSFLEADEPLAVVVDPMPAATVDLPAIALPPGPNEVAVQPTLPLAVATPERDVLEFSEEER